MLHMPVGGGKQHCWTNAAFRKQGNIHGYPGPVWIEVS